MSLKKTTLAVAAAALAVLSISSGTAFAAQVTRNFEFSSTSGPLQFGPTIGSFTYDDSVAPVGGGAVLQTGLFSDLSVSFGSWTFDESTANSGWLQFDALGGLIEAHFGNNCSAGSCGIVSGSEHWWIRVGVPGRVNDFEYSGYNGAETFYSTFANRLLPVSSVPEPSALALLGLGFAGLVATRRRKK